MKKIKRVFLLLLCMAFGLAIIACGKADGKVASKRDAIRYVRKNISEKCSFVKEEVVSESPRKVIYTFQSDARGFEFEVIAERWPHGLGDAVFYYEPTIIDYYSIQVHNYYDDRMSEVFGDLLDPDMLYFYISSTEDIEKLSKAIVKASKIYAEEREYNTDEFLKEEPYCKGKVWAKTEDDDWYTYTDIPIDGTSYNEEDVKKQLFQAVAQDVKDGELSAEDFPGIDKYTESLHVTYLNDMYINGTKIESYTSEDSDRAEEVCGAEYDNDKQSYMMAIDEGIVVSRGCLKPYCIPSVVAALGGEFSSPEYTYHDLPTRLKAEWTINGHTWEASINCEHPENQKLKYSDLEVTRDGEKLDVEYEYTVDSWYFETISIDDFCKLFDLSYEIDEEEGVVYFTSI